MQNYEEGLRYIGRLPFEQAESNMKRYGKTLMHHVPEGTTLLLKGLCTKYQPDGAGEDGVDHDLNNKVNLRCLRVSGDLPVAILSDCLLQLQANSEEFIPVFANNPRKLKAFLEHMIKVDPHSPQGVYDTLLELRLQDWAHEQDSAVSSAHTSALILMP